VLVDVVEEVVRVSAMERVDGPPEEVEVDDERDPVGSGCKAAGGHERPVEAVGAGEEALEGDGGGRRVGVVVCIVEGRLGVVVGRRGAVPSVAEVGCVGRGRLGRLGGLGDGRERLDVGRGPAEEPPRHHGAELGLLPAGEGSVGCGGGGARFEWHATWGGGCLQC